MRAFGLPVLAIAALACLATPSFADEPAFPLDPFGLFRQPPSPPSVADETNPGFVYAQPDGAGPYSCQLGEKRTRLQRRACGPLKPGY